MRLLRGIAAGAGTVFLAAMSAGARDFSYWAKKGENAGDLDEKIEFFTKALSAVDYSDDFSEAIRMDPGSASGYNGLGFALFDKGDFRRAEASFVKSLRMDKTADSWAGLAMVFLARDKKNRALAAYRKAIELEPVFAEGSREVLSETSHFYTDHQKQALDELAGLVKKAGTVAPARRKAPAKKPAPH